MNNLEITSNKSAIYKLTENNSSYIKISSINDELLNYGKKYFNELFELHPKDRHAIIKKNTNCEKQVFRWQSSFLNTPDYDYNNDYFKEYNYMYSGLDTSNNKQELPELFKKFYDYVKLIDNRYNQVIINWYDTNDYIEFHRDCQRKLLKDIPILIINLTEDDNNYRNFEIVPYDRNSEDIKYLYSNISVSLINGLIIEMCGNTQTEFRHGIRQNNEFKRRISISFRAFE